MNEDRQRMQKEQTKAWLCQQIQERQAAEKERKDAEEAYKAAVIARDSRAIELDQMEKECRKRLELACARYNQALVLTTFTTFMFIYLTFYCRQTSVNLWRKRSSDKKKKTIWLKFTT